MKPELLAPAGDLERLKIAFLYGADAVYIGGTLFGLRANAANFTLEEIKMGVEYAHKLGKKVYVTVNIVLHNKEIKFLKDYLKKLDEYRVDAIIVSDPTVIQVAHENTNLDIHLSTQQSTLNRESIEFFKNQGISRIVLARECSKDDIKSIKKNINIELEMFIHGAMCTSYSGRCVLSNYFTNRDSNRGGCSQVCRWDFNLLDSSLNNIKGEKDFTFCSKDLSMLKYIPELIDMGINSFKIEGRMRSLYYIATIVSVYRKVIDEYCNNKENYKYNIEYEKILSECANRSSVTQFYNNIYDNTCSYYNGRQEISNQDFLGIILDYDQKTSFALVEQRNYFKKGDVVEVFGPKTSITTFKIDEILDINDEKIEIVRHPKQIVKIKFNKKLYRNDIMKIKK
ncbi:MAG: U32 family peptidase [Clostridium sp.]|nr:U32 family peptidase [Clostridium sp.]MCM1444130.1 U32 family peptidase [Candidatus Amulumruptor caecigallinarius]